MTPPDPRAGGRWRPDRGLLRSVLLLCSSAPVLLLALVLAGWVVDVLELDLDAGSRDAVVVNVAVLLAAGLPLVGAAWLGAAAWRRTGGRGGLVVCALAVAAAAVLVLAPAVL